MNGRARHKFDRLKKLAKPQKADVFSITLPVEDVVIDPPEENIEAKEAEVFTIHQSIEVKKAE